MHSIDYETYRFGPGNMAPKPVCLSQYDGSEADLVDREESFKRLERWLQSDVVLCGWFIAYDMAVACAHAPHLIPLIFAAYREDKILCGKVLAKLYDLATIGDDYTPVDKRHEDPKSPYSLKTSAWRFERIVLDKSKYRLDYGDLDGLPLEQWESGARDYAILDSIATYKTIHKILEKIEKEEVPFLWAEWGRQSRRSFWIQLMACQGWYTDPVYCEQLEAYAREEQKAVAEVLVPHGILHEETKGRKPNKYKTGKLITKYKATLRYCLDKGYVTTYPAKDKRGRDIEKVRPGEILGATPTGKLAIDKLAIKRLKDPVLSSVARWKRLGKDITEAQFMRKGMTERIHFRYDSLKNTGRTSAGRIQNRERAFGYRECFIPDKGEVLCSIDYGGNESRTLAQIIIDLFGSSKFADALNRGEDMLCAYAAVCNGWTYEETYARWKAGDKTVKTARQNAKAPIYGLPGMMGECKFIDYGRDVWGATIPPTEISLEPMEGFVELPSKKHWDATVLTRALPPEVLRHAEDDDAIWDPGMGSKHRRVYCRWLHESYPKLYCKIGCFQWLKAMWYEMDPNFLRYKGAIQDEIKETGGITQHRSGRFRANCSIPEGANSKFQGLAGDGGAEAGWQLAVAMYADSDSPIYGRVRTKAFIHDEFIFSVKIVDCHTVPWELAKVQCRGMDVFTPDVPSIAEPALMRRWTKNAETAHDTEGNLVPWEDWRLKRGIHEDMEKVTTDEDIKRLVDEKKDLLEFFSRHKLQVIGTW